MKSFLCGDFGAGTLKVAEFQVNPDGSLTLRHYALRSLGLEGSQDANRQEVLLRSLQDLLSDKRFSSKDINICAAGFNVFSKFVKLPPVDAAKVTQIIQYEAQQNVPFPLEEVAWDYQILGAAPSGELEVLLVAIKTEIIEALFKTVEKAGIAVHLVDASPAALCNAYRYNYGDEEGCTMLLDIGAKTSNLLFFEKGKVFSRSINIGANAITQDFGTEARLGFPEAEQIKIEQGFVGLGGAYAEPDNPHQAQISKIARQVMTRLHIQMNQTIQFYRNQQGGTAPARLYLAGGATLMPYTSQFFAEKLNIPVDYFNPLRNVDIGSDINLEALAPVAHTLGEVVGLGIRNLAQCPVELNLMPKSHIKRAALKKKQPYLMAAVFSVVLIVGAWGMFYQTVAGARRASTAKLKPAIDELAGKETTLQGAANALVAEQAQADVYKGYVLDRLAWVDLINGLQKQFSDFEARQKAELKVDTGVWIESLISQDPKSGQVAPAAAPFGSGAAAGAAPAPTAGTINYVFLRCRAVNLAKVAPDANTKFTFAFEQELKTNALFEVTNTKLEKVEAPDATATNYSFQVTLQLKRPITAY
jgi:type IV pilus assembly protein PilM